MPESPPSETWGPLQGVKVVSCSTAQAGTVPYMLMADLGADVIKIEVPEGGDSSRSTRDGARCETRTRTPFPDQDFKSGTGSKAFNRIRLFAKSSDTELAQKSDTDRTQSDTDRGLFGRT